MTHQLTLLDIPTPTVVTAAPIPRPTTPASPPQLAPGALVVPKPREGYPVPLFPGQVCEVIRLGRSLGRERVFCVPVKWMGRGVSAFPCDAEDLLVLAPAVVSEEAPNAA